MVKVQEYPYANASSLLWMEIQGSYWIGGIAALILS